MDHDVRAREQGRQDRVFLRKKVHHLDALETGRSGLSVYLTSIRLNS